MVMLNKVSVLLLVLAVASFSANAKDESLSSQNISMYLMQIKLVVWNDDSDEFDWALRLIEKIGEADLSGDAELMESVIHIKLNYELSEGAVIPLLERAIEKGNILASVLAYHIYSEPMNGVGKNEERAKHYLNIFNRLQEKRNDKVSLGEASYTLRRLIDGPR